MEPGTYHSNSSVEIIIIINKRERGWGYMNNKMAK